MYLLYQHLEYLLICGYQVLVYYSLYLPNISEGSTYFYDMPSFRTSTLSFTKWESEERLVLLNRTNNKTSVSVN